MDIDSILQNRMAQKGFKPSKKMVLRVKAGDGEEKEDHSAVFAKLRSNGFKKSKKFNQEVLEKVTRGGVDFASELSVG